MRLSIAKDHRVDGPLACFFVIALLLASVPTAAQTEQIFRSSGKAIRCEMFVPVNARKAPAVLILHGGAGMTMRAADFRSYAKELASHGYVAFVPHYFDATDSTTMDRLTSTKLALWIKAVHDAVTFASQHDAVDGTRIGLIGFSLGSLVGLAESREDGRIKALSEYYVGGLNLLPTSAGRFPPTLILHGEADRNAPIEGAYRLKALLERQKVPYEMKTYPGKDHAFDVTDPADAWSRTLKFLDKYLRD